MTTDTISISTSKRIYMAGLALLGWFGIILQFYLLLANKETGISLWGRFFNFFSYFTILTNILVALCLTLTLSNSSSRIGRFFRNDVVHASLTLYILIVGIVYYLLLRNIWKPQGWHFVADATLHYAVPVLYFVYWLVFVSKGKLKWSTAITLMIYPGVYFVYSLIRGAFVHWYPYPFINAETNGYETVLKNAVLLLAAFVFAGLIFIGIDKLLAKSSSKRIAVN